MRLISAGSLVRAQSGPVFARAVHRERGLSHRSLGEGGPPLTCHHKRRELRLGKPFFLLPLLKTENKQTARGQRPQTVQAREMRKRMPELECAPVGGQDGR